MDDSTHFLQRRHHSGCHSLNHYITDGCTFRRSRNHLAINGIGSQLVQQVILRTTTDNVQTFNRELRNTVEYLVVASTAGTPGVNELPEQFKSAPEIPAGQQSSVSPVTSLSLEENNYELIRQALEQCGGNRTAAAKLLGISRRTLHRRLAEMDSE